jgi:Xaa-Pro aminopeptidase
MIKTPQEADLLAEVAYRTDHGIAGAAHHTSSKSSKTEKFFAEDIRVHCLERQVDVVGYHAISQVASGAHAAKLWPLPPKFGLGWDNVTAPGEMVRMEMRSCLHGYWSDAARIMIMGEPTLEQAEAYQGLVALRETAVRHMEPGIKCSAVFEAVRTEAERTSVDLLDGLGVGHGVGVTPYEAPYLTGSDGTELAAGMVIVIDPVVRTARGEILRSKDTVILTEAGCVIVGWYQDWRVPYTTAHTF